ncbi:Kelch motif family protein [Tritrichomonas foetus]|uniref:Kelch motif family protein n=1 Tax=Tritrichomonas foetus TaxID=1144522 RepID=A0A1J4J384_9EUKA|nr:Kelch motif family protein [Tritrichomonas foetus]|eukprot:OHS93886.1 Kelch motif family protein [Tritrichomonas foetus]
MRKINQKARAPSPGTRVFAPEFAAKDCRRVFTSRNSGDKSESNNEQEDINLLLPFGSVWSLIPTKGDAPAQCSGQSINYVSSKRSIYCAYGQNLNESFSSQFWQFSLDTKEWKRLSVKGVTPRAGCGSTYFDNKIWFFGGLSKPNQAVQDLHYIDLDTLEMVQPETKGPTPPPCANPLMTYYNKFIVIWASTGAPMPSSLYKYNTETSEWTKIDTEYIFRSGACGTLINTTYYIFGLSVPRTVLALDLKDFTMKVIPTTGVEPPISLENLSTVAMGSTFFAFETIGSGSKTRLFVFDCERANWLCYSVILSEDAKETDAPRIVFYIEDERKLIAVWESSDIDSQPLTELSVGQPMAQVNQHLDFLTMLGKGSQVDAKAK